MAGGSPSNVASEEACYWQSSQATRLSPPPPQSFSTGVWGASADGSILVGGGSIGSDEFSFRWKFSTGLIKLGNGAYSTELYATSADGELLAGLLTTDGGDSAAIWDAQRGWQNIHDLLETKYGVVSVTGWYLESVRCISADGQTVAGTGYNPQGNYEGWIAFIPRPAPCPADVNGDRVVDLSDIAAELSLFGATPASPNYSLAGDIDESGVVDLSDLATLLANFGQICP